MLQKSKGYKKGSRKVSRSFRRRKKKCQYIHEQLKTFVSIKKKSWLNLENIVLKCGKTSCKNYVIQIVYNCF